MPIPKRKSNEQEQEFIARCAEELIGGGEYEREQALAICYQNLDIQLSTDKQWRRNLVNNPFKIKK
jgi:hypothetical protein